MEQSAHNLTESPPKPHNGFGNIDTPRTSNLKFLRAKRLNYFCGKSVQSQISNTEETQGVGAQKNRKHTRSQTPRRCHSAPASKQEHSVSAACIVQTGGNVRANITSTDEGIYLQAADASHPILQGNVGIESSAQLPSDHGSPPSKHEGKTMESTHHNNLQPAPETSLIIPNSLLPDTSNLQEVSAQHYLQPAAREDTKGPRIQHSLLPSQEKIFSSPHILQPIQTEAKESSICNNPQSKPITARAKNVSTHNYVKPEPVEAEINVPSSHRSLLRSSFVSDLDQDLLEDLSVPETEKLQHVMTWAKKFLNKCDGGSTLPFREGDDMPTNDMDERILSEKYLKLNKSTIDSSAQFDVCVGFHDSDFKKQSYLNDQYKESAPVKFCVSKSPRNTFRTKSVFNHITETGLFSPQRPVSTGSHSDRKADMDNFSKPLQIRYPQVGTDRPNKDPFRRKSCTLRTEQFLGCSESRCSDDEDIFRNGLKSKQRDNNIQISKVSESDVDIKDNFRDREDTSSTESSLDTERLTALLESLDIYPRGSENKANAEEKDGERTDRTFLVRKCAESDDNTPLSVSKNILDCFQPHPYRVCSEDSASKVYQVCPMCGFYSSTKTSWCTECGSILNSDKDLTLRNDTENKSPQSPIVHENVLDDFFNVKKDIVRGHDKIPMAKQNDKECGRTVCWEDDSDIVSDSDGSVLEKYFIYVQQLDMLKREKEKQSKYLSPESSGEVSSDDESSKEYPKPQIYSGILKSSVTGRHVTCDGDDDDDDDDEEEDGTATQFLENPNILVKSDCHFDQQTRKESHLLGSTEKSYETEMSNPKGPLDRKLQKSTLISSKVTGPKRYWEKSSIAWSSYTHGELKPRSHEGSQRPASAGHRKNNQQHQGDRSTRAVSEHLSQSYWDGQSNSLQWSSEDEHGSMWLFLPDELWIYVFSQLSHEDLSKVTQVCQRFRYIANDDSLWKVIKMTNRHFLNDTCLANIGLHHPESLSLYRCHDDTQSITEEGLGNLFQHCKNSLMALNVTNCSGPRLEGDLVLLTASNYCTRLTSVDISWTAATDKGIISLVEASAQLQSLSMNGCKITDDAITALLKKHCKSLTKIEIFGCHALSTQCLISVATECTHLENLNIGRIPKATDVCLAKIASNLQKISTLNLTGLNVVRDRSVHHIVKQCSKLENLTLSSCSQVTDVSLVEISTYLRTIKYLDLSGCKKVSDIGIQALARSCQEINYLDLSSTGVGKRGVCLLASYCYATLECLKLSFCKAVTADAVEKLCKNCKRLKMLHLYGCPVSPDLEYIKQCSKSFQIFHDLSIPTAKILGE
ncbi:uncharacterized protein LOC134895092 isoform X2 [Pseudophryne corroboree]|uniref:uncharacterized protein LOC134895092 isoform X2 n=1 Tax=Pseudophryne corroboree TaxID=495146 RepID=UPI0030816465